MQLTITLLGAPTVAVGATAVTFRTRKVLALLLYLLLEQRPVPREQLIALFWPDVDEQRGRANLRRALALVRSGLAAAGWPHADRLLVSAGASVRLDPGLPLTSDLRSFHEHIALATAATQPAEQLAHYAAALAAGSGTLLDGVEIAAPPELALWVHAQRSAWQIAAAEAYARATALQLAHGTPAEASALALRWVQHDPLSEAAYGRLIAAQLARGDRGAAQEACAACAAMLLREFGQQPAAETVALLAPNGEPAPAPQTRRPASDDWTLAGPLVGRGEPLGALIRVYERLDRAAPQLVVLSGEAGIGKSRLAHAFLEWAQQRGADLLIGRANPGGGQLPYQPLLDALGPRLEQERAPDDLLPDVWLSELARLMPELHDRYPDLPSAPADPETARTRLFEAVTRLVQALAARAPLVWLVDDLHWADSASLDLLRYLLNRCARAATPLVVLVTLRRDAVATLDGALHPVERWLSEAPREIARAEVALTPISTSATTELLRALTVERDGSLLQAAFVAWLYRATQGQPLYLIQTLKALRERGLLMQRQRPDGSWGLALPDLDATLRLAEQQIPDGVLAVIRVRLAALSEPARAVLAAAAVLGAECHAALLWPVAAVDQLTGLSALEELVARQLLEPHDRGAAGYRFTHDKIREVIAHDLSDARRQALHARALAIYEQRGATAAVLAHHAHAAGLAERAFGAYLLAGDAALAVFATDQAVTAYELARQILTTVGVATGFARSIDPLAIERLYAYLGFAYERAHTWTPLEALYTELEQFALTIASQRLRWSALTRLAFLRMLQAHDGEAALAILDQAYRLAEAIGDAGLLADTAYQQARVAADAFQPARALPHAQHALALALALGDEARIAACQYTLGFCYTAANDWEPMVAALESARAMYQRLQARTDASAPLPTSGRWASAATPQLTNRQLEGTCAGTLAVGYTNLGQPERAVALARVSLAISTETRNELRRHIVLLNLCHGLEEAGHYAEALDRVTEGLALARQLPNPQETFWLLLKQAHVAQALWQLETARAALLEALAIAEATPTRAWRLLPLTRLVAVAALADDWPLAADYTLTTIPLRRAAPPRLLWLDFYRYHEVTALLHVGQAAQADAEIRHLAERVGSNRRFELVLARMRAARASSADSRVEHLARAAQLADQLGLPGEQWQIAADLADHYRSHGAAARAAQQRQRATQVLLRLAEPLPLALRAGLLRARRIAEPLDTPNIQPALTNI